MKRRGFLKFLSVLPALALLPGGGTQNRAPQPALVDVPATATEALGRYTETVRKAFLETEAQRQALAPGHATALARAFQRRMDEQVLEALRCV